MSLLQFRDVDFDDGEHAPVKGIDFSLAAGRRLFVFGRSGAGKSTILKLAAGLLVPGDGEVTLAAPPGCRLPLGYVAKEGGLLSNLSLLDNAVLPVVYHKILEPRAAEKKARRLFAELGIEAHAGRRPTEVGISARRLALIAQAVLAEPLLFVVEDPLLDVDAATARAIKGLIERVGHEGRSLILGTSRLGPFGGWEASFLYLRGGRGLMFENWDALRRTQDPDVRACFDSREGDHGRA